MAKEKIIGLIEHTIHLMHSRESQYDSLSDLLTLLRPYLFKERQAVVGALRDYLSFRIRKERRYPTDYIAEARIWTSIDLAITLKLTELILDVERLIKDVEQKQVLLPVNIPDLKKQLENLRNTK